MALSMVALIYLSIAPLFEDLVSCGLGPAPGSAGYEQHVQAQEVQRRTLGYQQVCEGYMRHFNHASRAEPLHEATRRLAFTPVSLESTPFKDLNALGGRPDFFGDEGAAALHRTFRTPQGFIVDLREWDLSVSGGQVWGRAELQTKRVNGAPAQLTVLQAPSGRAVSTLAWTEGRRRYELVVNANVNTVSVVPTLLDLASSIPKSVPARSDGGPPAFPSPLLPLRPGE